MENNMLRIYAPASSANLSVGFDTLGTAVSPIDGSLLGDVVQIEALPSGFELESAGYFVRKLPKEAQKNIVYQAYVLFSERLKLRNIAVRPLRLTLEKICQLVLAWGRVRVLSWRRWLHSISFMLNLFLKWNC